VREPYRPVSDTKQACYRTAFEIYPEIYPVWNGTANKLLQCCKVCFLRANASCTLARVTASADQVDLSGTPTWGMVETRFRLPL